MTKVDETPRPAPPARQARPKPSYTQLSKKLVPSLSSFEIAIYTAAWVVGVFYSVFTVYRLSKSMENAILFSNLSATFFLVGLHRRLYQQDFEMSWYFETLWRKDVSDHEWMVFSEVILSSLPWLAIHFVGSQWLKKNNKQVRKKEGPFKYTM